MSALEAVTHRYLVEDAGPARLTINVEHRNAVGEHGSIEEWSVDFWEREDGIFMFDSYERNDEEAAVTRTNRLRRIERTALLVAIEEAIELDYGEVLTPFDLPTLRDEFANDKVE